MNMNKFMAFLPVLLLVSTQLIAKPPINPIPFEVDAFVTNDETNPVPVVVQSGGDGAPNQQPVQCSVLGTFSGDGVIGQQLGTCIVLPGNQRLIITDGSIYYSGFNNTFVVPVGSNITAAVRTDVDGNTADHVIGHGSIYTGEDNEAFQAGRRMEVFADPGTNVTIQIYRNYTGETANLTVILSGYLEAVD
jgi:hypothetical protein